MATSGDVVAVLKAQHQEVKGLLEKVGSATGPQRGQAFRELKRFAVVHETSEEETVYPAIRATGEDGRRLADARVHEQAEALQVFTRLEAMDSGSQEFATGFGELRTAMLAHAESEEAEVFPLLKSTQSQEALRDMAATFEVAQRQGEGDRPAKEIEHDVRDALRKAS
jgi:hemerythrin superfamily protein